MFAGGGVPSPVHTGLNCSSRVSSNPVLIVCASAPVESKNVSLTAPEIAENGAVVPMSLASTLPSLKHLLVLVEKNPNPLVAKFDVSDAVEPNFAIRVKMGQSSDVFAVAITRDNKAFFTRKEVKVTLGGCGG